MYNRGIVFLLASNKVIKYMNKIIRNIGIALVLILIGVGIWQNNTGPKKSDVITIGVVAPLSGNLAFLGEGMKNAVVLAEEQLNKSGKHTYRVIVEDDGFDVKRTASALSKLVSIDKVNAVVTIASAAGNVAKPIAEQNKIVHFAIASDPHIAEGMYNFIHWTPPVEEVKVFVPELQKRGFKRLAVFGAKIQGIQAVVDELSKQLGGTDIEIVYNETHNFGVKDYRTMIAKAKATNPDIYVLEEFSPELEILAKQLREAGIREPITSIESFEQTEQFSLFEGSWYVNAADATGEFIDAYTKRFGKGPTLGTPNAYDIVNLIVSAGESIDGQVTNEKLAEALLRVKDQKGALGNLTINPDGLVLSKAVVRMIKDGKPVTISE
ncbi:ABC transporter substrate-binding protein [Patescibacteria group bacterium]|nr:MAG: ABC transporter substrate-binding protein [Patescibacteria group bacterium]